MKWSTTLCAAAVAAAVLTPAVAQVQVDPDLADYTVDGGVSGSIMSVGSDTMNNLMTLWSEAFKKMHPDVQIEIESKGSSTAPPALIAGQSTFGPMSRKMKDKEQVIFEAEFGHKAMPMRTAVDMLAVFVHKDNPIAQTGLALEQLDAIFSKTRKGGHTTVIVTWGDVGLTGEWADRPISLYGRNSASGTYGYFRKHALFNGDYKDQVKEQPGSSSVVQGVASDKYAIGYSGIGYRTAGVAVVPLAKSGDNFVEAGAATVKSYPLTRFLYVYVNFKPGTQLDPLRAEFLKLTFSKTGQEVVIKDGYIPVPADIARADLESVGITPLNGEDIYASRVDVIELRERSPRGNTLWEEAQARLEHHA